MLVDYANTLRARGYSKLEAIHESAHPFPPDHHDDDSLPPPPARYEEPERELVGA